MSEIFLSSTTKGAVWVLRDTRLSQKRVCGKYSMQKSILKINKCRAFSTLESQYIYASFQSAVIQVELEVKYSLVSKACKGGS